MSTWCMVYVQLEWGKKKRQQSLSRMCSFYRKFTTTCRKIIELLKHDNLSIVTPALRTVGNIATGDDTQTQVRKGGGGKKPTHVSPSDMTIDDSKLIFYSSYRP